MASTTDPAGAAPRRPTPAREFPRRVAGSGIVRRTLHAAGFGIALATVLHGLVALELSAGSAAVVFAACAVAAVGALQRSRWTALVGRDVGTYRLIEMLAAGGMGEVWRAEQRPLARPVAVKLIRADHLRPGFGLRRRVREQFRREAHAMAMLRSPHTVDVYDYGTTPDGAPFYAMELLEGYDLETLVRRFGPQPVGRVIQMLVAVSSSLAEAHERGLVHCDVKPGNIYLCRYDGWTDFVKVLDFGLVTTYGAEASGAHSEAVDTETVYGTPLYMSPEQITGSTSIGPASDVYSLGCVAYRLITGQVPFSGQNHVEVMVQQLTAAPLPLTALSPGPVPVGLERLILDCLEKEPEARPRSMREVLARLQVIAVEEPWTAGRALAWWREHAPRGEARAVRSGSAGVRTDSTAPTEPPTRGSA